MIKNVMVGIGIFLSTSTAIFGWVPGELPRNLVEEISVDDYGNPIFQFTITTVDWGPDNTLSVSYTHLTLPTNREV